MNLEEDLKDNFSLVEDFSKKNPESKNHDSEKNSESKNHDKLLDDKLLALLARYLCILTTGLFERFLLDCMDEYYKRNNTNSKKPSFLKKGEFGGAEIKQILSKISKLENGQALESELKNKLEDKDKELIDSMVDDRNLAAHGENTSFTYSDVCNWRDSVLKVAKEIELLLKK